MKIFLLDGVTYKLGESAKDNWCLLDNSQNYHMFFHLSAFPSGYVILECEKNPDIKMLTIASEICKNGTKYKNLRNLKIDYCRCDNLEKGDNIGDVLFISNRKVKQLKI